MASETSRPGCTNPSSPDGGLRRPIDRHCRRPSAAQAIDMDCFTTVLDRARWRPQCMGLCGRLPTTRTPKPGHAPGFFVSPAATDAVARFQAVFSVSSSSSPMLGKAAFAQPREGADVLVFICREADRRAFPRADARGRRTGPSSCRPGSSLCACPGCRSRDSALQRRRSG